ncbi:hypothetical protein [Anaerobacillus sp. 1_MG-2023]|uniref:hypothetical protein n=1 Tax=Anaerobacillus sp. 1_MG-2023 TaxID=3062655 RepID=UPI0026E3A2A2|nr:hypothetical protein [Anaerobacillus sp. 1_MG-2023]MDO6658657.1 hypothetical protein [Anaerobacillus sp. 1_MG-2023]
MDELRKEIEEDLKVGKLAGAYTHDIAPVTAGYTNKDVHQLLLQMAKEGKVQLKKVNELGGEGGYIVL